MNDKEKIGNLLNTKYKRLFFIGVLLLAFFLIFSILKPLERPSFEPYPISKSSGERLCIENVWNELDNIAFTMRNCGDVDINKDDFAKTLYYINHIKRECISNIIGSFKVNATQNVTCPINMKEICTTECNIPIRVLIMTGGSDTHVFQYVTK